MSSNSAVAALWGKILVHNKLVTQEQWNAVLALHDKYQGKVTIEEILVKKKLVAPKSVEVVRKRVAEIVEKARTGKLPVEGGAPAAQEAEGKSNPPAPATGSVPSSAPPATAVDDEPEEIPDSEPTPAPVAGPASAQAKAPAAPAPADDADEIPLAAEPPSDDEPNDITASKNMSDLDWVANTDEAPKAAPKKEGPKYPGDDEFDGPIDLVADDDAPNKEQKKIVVNESLIPVSKNIRHGGGPTPKFRDAPPTPPPVAPPKPAVPSDGIVVTAERIPCEVAPNDMDPEAASILRKAAEIKASDCHLAAGSAPFFRLHGTLVFLDMPKLTPERSRRIALGFMDDAQQQHFLKYHDLDFSYEMEGVGRMRANCLDQFRGTDSIFRLIPTSVPSLEELGLPLSLGRFTEWAQGLVLVTGPAGSGKTTTAAALVNLVNQARKDHVITVEDPVEYLHVSTGCNVTQRQVPIHTKSFASALKAALREDPDVIMIGEMRDLETVSLAIRAAETGHLVIGTLQTKSAARTIDRVIDVFPTDQQSQIRTMLSESLRGIISQQLVPRLDGKGRVVAVEVLHVSNAISNLIRDAKTFQINSIMQTGKKIGQRLLDDSLIDLYQAGIISREDALKITENPKNFPKEKTAAGADAAAANTAAGNKRK